MDGQSSREGTTIPPTQDIKYPRSQGDLAEEAVSWNTRSLPNPSEVVTFDNYGGSMITWAKKQAHRFECKEKTVDHTNKEGSKPSKTEIQKTLKLSSTPFKPVQPDILPQKNTDEQAPTIEISLIQWNGRSLNYDKAAFIKTLGNGLVCLQEIWQQKDLANNIGTVLDCRVREGERGGGTALINTSPTKIHTIQAIKINKDTNAIKLRINQLWFCWIVNYYNHDGSLIRHQKLFRQIRQHIPESEWDSVCILGDFNTNLDEQSSKYKALKNLAKVQQMVIQDPGKNTHKEFRIDYMMHGRRWKNYRQSSSA